MAMLPGTSTASHTVDDDESRAEATAMCQALARALATLPAADQLLLQLRYWAGHSVARIATMTGDDQKLLYRRFARLAAALRARLEAEGLSGRAVALLTGRFDVASEGDTPEALAVGIPVHRPSTLPSTGGEHA